MDIETEIRLLWGLFEALMTDQQPLGTDFSEIWDKHTAELYEE